MEDRKGLSVVEDPIIVEKYEKLKVVGKSIFSFAEISNPKDISPAHVDLAKQFLSDGAKKVNPEVWSSYWEHVIIAPELGKRIAKKLEKTGSEFNPSEVEFLLWLHDIGRLVTPAAYFRNDLIGERLLKESGLPQAVIDELPSNGKLMIKGEELELSENQLSFQAGLDENQDKLAQEYFAAMNPTQRIVNLANNLGKRTNGEIFDVEKFVGYLKSQEGRYSQNSDWASINWAIPRRRNGAVLQAYTAEKTAQWLKDQGVNVNEILDELKDYVPKVVSSEEGLVTVTNPDNKIFIAYFDNQDSKKKQG